MEFSTRGSQYYYLINGNDLVKIEFQFNWDDDPKDSGYLQEVTIDTEDGPLSFKRKGPNDEKGNIVKERYKTVKSIKTLIMTVVHRI